MIFPLSSLLSAQSDYLSRSQTLSFANLDLFVSSGSQQAQYSYSYCQTLIHSVRLSFIQSHSHSFSQILSQSVSRALSGNPIHSVKYSFAQSSVSHTLIQLVGLSAIQFVSHSLSQTLSHSLSFKFTHSDPHLLSQTHNHSV